MARLLVLQHELCEHLGVFADILDQHHVSYRYIKLFEGEHPPPLEGYSGLIILGGPMGANQDAEYPFLKVEDALIKRALKGEVPMLGVCLGAQLIAKAAGANVYPGACKEIGWYRVDLTDYGLKDRLFKGFERCFTAFQWHGDTFDIPAGGVRLAESELFPNQALALGSVAYGLQFHLEVTLDMVSEWVERYRDELDSLRDQIDPAEVVNESERHIGELNRHASILCTNFIRLLK